MAHAQGKTDAEEDERAAWMQESGQVHPQIIQISRRAARQSKSSEHPQVSLRVDPTARMNTATRNIVRTQDSLSAKGTVLIDDTDTAPGHPCPLPAAVSP